MCISILVCLEMFGPMTVGWSVLNIQKATCLLFSYTSFISLFIFFSSFIDTCNNSVNKMFGAETLLNAGTYNKKPDNLYIHDR